MALIVNGNETLINGDTYIFNSKHRTKNPFGSQWTIELKLELDLMNDSLNNNYIELINNSSKLSQSYNFLKENNKLKSVGLDNYRQEELILCKYVETSDKLWHGYPGNYCKYIQDRPNENTLQNMLNKSLITKKEMAKISKGQR